MSRRFWVLIHRYAGLYMALFLIIAGLTGSILAFYHELDHWLNPENSPESARISVQNRPLLSPLDLRDEGQKLFPNATIHFISLEIKQDALYTLQLQPRVNPATGENFPLAYDSITLNPYTGKEISRSLTASVQEGYFPLTRKNILAFIYALHYHLALGKAGGWLFWVTTILWTADCFVGFYLTLPPRPRKQFLTIQTAKTQQLPYALSLSKGFWNKLIFLWPVLRQVQHERCNGASALRTFWQRWKPSWKVKWPASFSRVNFDLHRAFGLWLWLMLFVFAWSSVMLESHMFDNLPPVSDKVMKTIFDYPPEEPPRPELVKPIPNPAIDFRTAYSIGQMLMKAQSEMRHFKVKRASSLDYDQTNGYFEYTAYTDRDLGGNNLTATVKFDAATGRLLWSEPLWAGDYSGLTITAWMYELHMAAIWGLPYKVFVCLMGLVITMLSVTGVYIWFKKHRAARAKHNKITSGANIPGLNK